MAEISKGAPPSERSIAVIDGEERTLTEINNRLRDRGERETDHDDIGEILLALQVLIPAQESLALGSNMNGKIAQNKVSNKVNSRSCQLFQLMEGGRRTISSNIVVEKSNIYDMSPRQSEAFTSGSGQYAGAEELRKRSASMTSHADLMISENSIPQRKYLEKVRGKNLDEDNLKRISDASAKLPRERFLERFSLPSSKRQGVHESPVLSLNGIEKTKDDTGWVYSFRSWGGQHAVRISPQVENSKIVMPHSKISLHPSSFFVEQRLCEYGRISVDGGQCGAMHHDDEQKKDRQQRNDQNEEDA